MQSQAMTLLTSQTTNEWYTPQIYTAMARKVMGSIDLDPCTAALPQTWICATKCLTIEQDGLRYRWRGNVWLNPPFADTARWLTHLESEYSQGFTRQAVVLCNSNLGYNWYEEFYRKWPICLVRDRIRFINEAGMAIGQAKRGQTFAYLGQNYRAFIDEFKAIGRILLP
jgi:DNA N-6-adenine-methyltransferase Dam